MVLYAGIPARKIKNLLNIYLFLLIYLDNLDARAQSVNVGFALPDVEKLMYYI